MGQALGQARTVPKFQSAPVATSVPLPEVLTSASILGSLSNLGFTKPDIRTFECCYILHAEGVGKVREQRVS